MAWNADATRMPYRMHSEYLHTLFLQNALTQGQFMVGGHAVALPDIRAPIFAVGTVRDHVAPWQSVYKIMLHSKTDVTFVLTSGGHNAGIVSEPKHVGRSYQIATTPSAARYTPPQQWQQNTPVQQGSWWVEWNGWLKKQSSAHKIAPPSMGNALYAPLQPAPGLYVLQP